MRVCRYSVPTGQFLVSILALGGSVLEVGSIWSWFLLDEDSPWCGEEGGIACQPLYTMFSWFPQSWLMCTNFVTFWYVPYVLNSFTKWKAVMKRHFNLDSACFGVLDTSSKVGLTLPVEEFGQHRRRFWYQIHTNSWVVEFFHSRANFCSFNIFPKMIIWVDRVH